MTVLDIELAVANNFGYRQNLIVPNVSWGLNLGHEADMFIVSPSGYATEVEIKVSASDLKRDLLKLHNHASPRIKRYYFAVPKKLETIAKTVAHEHWGILTLSDPDSYFMETARPARVIKGAKPLTTSEIIDLGRLAAMRIWTLKRSLKDKIDRSKIKQLTAVEE